MVAMLHHSRHILLALAALLPAHHAVRTPEGELATITKAYLSLGHPADWQGIEKLPGIRWAPLPPTSLATCLPTGDCFARQGSAALGGRAVTVVATGARTMVFSLYVRNTGAAIGETAALAALKAAGLTTTLVRCPARGGTGRTNWYRVEGAGASPGHLAIQPAATGRPQEGFVLSSGAELPAVPANQAALYTEQCAAGASREATPVGKPHEQLAKTVVTMLVPVTGAPLPDWKALVALPTGIAWDAAGPKAIDLSFKNDPNPIALGGTLNHSGRKFSVLVSGSATQVRTIYVDEEGMHPRGEHLLGVVYEQGIAVRLTRCGPIYTESTNNWYALTSAKTRPAMIRQSIRHDGTQVQDSYELRLDGSLPTRDPRDRNPGVNGC